MQIGGGGGSIFKAPRDGSLRRAEGQAVTRMSVLCQKGEVSKPSLSFFPPARGGFLSNAGRSAVYFHMLAAECRASAGHFTARFQLHSSPGRLISWLSPSRSSTPANAHHVTPTASIAALLPDHNWIAPQVGTQTAYVTHFSLAMKGYKLRNRLARKLQN